MLVVGLQVKHRQHSLTPRRPGDWWIIEQRKVIVSGSDLYDCERFLCLPRWSTKGNSSGLRVACGFSSCVGCAASSCGLGVWCLLARKPLSKWITITGTSLSASKWTSEEKSLCLDCLLGIHWLITCHGGIPLYHSLIFHYTFTWIELVVVKTR